MSKRRWSCIGSARLKVFAGILFLALLAPTVLAQAVMESVRAEHDIELNTDPASSFWRDAHPVYASVDGAGLDVAGLRTEVRSRWTTENIYFLFVCPFKHLSLKPAPDAQHETYELWNWNVAEIFLGTDFNDIKRYKEFEVSPQNEWIDLDVNLHNPHHEEGWVWNSGFEHVARIDQANHIWYAAMKIPLRALGVNAPAVGMNFRLNLYRTEGAAAEAKEVMWQPVMEKTFHVPERFGLLKLTGK